MAHADLASMELPGREQAWQHVTAAQPRYAKYQSKSDREHPVVRLALR